MNVTLYTSYDEAVEAAEQFCGDTGIDHLVIERLPEGPIHDPDTSYFVGDEIAKAEHRYTVLCRAEWAQVADDWDADVVYEVWQFTEDGATGMRGRTVTA